MNNIHLCVSLGLLFLISACTNLEQYQEPVNELAGDWAGLTEQVDDFADQLLISQKNTAGMILKMRAPENVDLGDEGRQQAETFITEARSHFENFETFNDELMAFMDRWEEHSDQLADLQEGLEAGEVSGDVPSQISYLQETLDRAQQKLTDWKTQLEATNQGIKSAYTSFMELLPTQEVAQ